MKLTKKREAEIKQVMDTYWGSYLNGDLDTWASFLPANYRNIGTTAEEIWNSKQEIVDYTRRVIDQMVGMAELRNKQVQIIPVDPYIMVHELGDLFVRTEDGWAFYAKFRLSSLLEKRKGRWKILHQHGSYPDSRTQEGETFAFDTLKAENLKLQEAVKARTIELEQKNRELGIETALEKVRAIAMGMKEPADMLEVCETISLQLQSLGVKDIRNVQTAIFYEGRGTYMNYEYYAKHKKTFITETTFTNNKIHKAFAMKMLKGEGEFFTTHIKGKKVKDWIAYQKTTNVFIDRYLNTASSLNYYWYSLGPVAMGISSYSPLTDDGLNLFKRFRNVFELAYRRYLDIEKAQAQAKEAQIEASLEKVRAMAMGMSKPEDLLNVCETLFKEFTTLGFESLRNAMINIHNDAAKSFINYDYSDEIGRSVNQLVYNIHPLVEKQIKKIRSANDAFSETYFTGRDLNTWRKFRRRIGEKDDPRLHKNTGLYYYFYSIGIGSIGISTFGPINEERRALLKRFRNVFALSYQRYTDIAKAEARAREARIEAALERIRAAAMSMHTSEDLKQVGVTIFSELKSLGFADIRNTEILINNDEKEAVLSHYYSDYGVRGTIGVFYNNHPVVKKWANDMKKASDAFAEVVISPKEIRTWRKYREEIGYQPDPKLNKAKSVWYYSYSTGLGALSVSSFRPMTEEQRGILERFRNVFGLAYRRYADVAQAEAHARESRIELALERVRARSMAMHKGDELQEVITLVFKQLHELGLDITSAHININDKAGKQLNLWIANEQNAYVQLMRVPRFDNPIMNLYMNAVKNRDPLFTGVFDGKVVQDFFRKVLSLPDFLGISKERKKYLMSVKGYAISGAVNTHTSLAINNYGSKPFSDEENDIVTRFGKVFEQTYIRFLDLRQAEAQAREAQIEAALEKVRSRSMAMHSSDELVEASDVVFQQLKTLGIESIRTGVATFNAEKETVEVWSRAGNQSGRKILGVVPKNVHAFFAGCFDAWKRKDEFYSQEFVGEEVEQYYRDMSSILSYPSYAPYNAREVFYTFFFPEGSVNVVRQSPLNDEETRVMLRFARVFGLMYRRFLDLQKAEAQAREAQIEAALERVRSRTMGMQHSSELKDTALLLFEQVKVLGIPAWGCGFNIWDDDKKSVTSWNSSEGQIEPPVKFPSDQDVFLRFYEAAERGETLYVEEMGGEALEAHYKFLTTLPGAKDILEQFSTAGIAVPKFQIFHTAFFAHGYLLFITYGAVPEAHDIFKRYAKVFEQTYIRFNDLKQAEAQAREARVELSLERIRAKVTAMKESSDLLDIVVVMRSEFVALGHEAHYFWHMRWLPDTYEKAMTSGDGTRIGMVMTLPRHIHGDIKLVADWEKSDEPTVVLAMDVETAVDYVEKMITLGDFVQVDPNAPTLDDIRHIGGLTFVMARTTHGEIGFSLPGTVYAPPKEAVETLARFAGVFDLAYRRFEDLKSAEYRNREAQAELALERVRARALAMQEPEELTDVARVLRQEMGALGVEELETSTIFIHDDGADTAGCWFAIKDTKQTEKRLVADHITLDLNATWVGREMLAFFDSDQSQVSIPMQGANRREWIEYCYKLSSILDGFYGGQIPDRTYHLYKFNNGAIGAAAPGAISDTSWGLLSRAASVFSLAYSRFRDLSQARSDLQRLKEEKKRAEEALTELRATQEQLLQQEKLASLGQLTAGIAHEIKNPLNFVNNFSSVSVELVDEAMEEIKKLSGNGGDAQQLLDDVKKNLNKIIEHGTRADGIVKSMLQHSRGGSGKKEPTDLNALVKEYVNLAFHGMRAGKNPINVDITLDLDPSVGTVPLIAEDFSRVVLNLCQNAFDAMREKLNSADRSYLPNLSARTRRDSNRIVMEIEDNGPGIPDAIKDKILQPFFTTKKGTQGTGLGLSITHDIVKAHGGTMTIESSEPTGTIFRIAILQSGS
jgi:signal transduction histidine kinase/ketosteroid isomerase-like protein